MRNTRMWMAAGAALLALAAMVVNAQDSRMAMATRADGASASAGQPLPVEVQATINAARSQKNSQMLETAADAYDQRNQYEIAKALLENALAVRGEVSGEKSQAYSDLLLKLGDLAVKYHKGADANGFYTRGLAFGDRPEASTALYYLGVTAVMRNQKDQAIDYLQRSLNVAPAGPKAGMAMMWMAMGKQREAGAEAEAESLYQRALSVEDPKSKDTATTMEMYARFLRAHDREADADSYEQRAREIRGVRTGPAPKPAEGVYKTGIEVKPPTLVSKVEPQYTEEARAAKLSGPVVLYTEIGPDGVARNTVVTKSVGLGLDEQAVLAISQWRFNPGTKDGQPVTVAAIIEVNFRLL